MTLRRARCLAALVALLAVTGLSGCVRAAPTERTQSSPAARPAAARSPVVVFLGDSYTAGGTYAPPQRTYAAGTAHLLGWQVVIGGRAGTGFVAPGRTKEPFQLSFERQLAWRPAPDLVIVAGGHNDRKAPLFQTAAAARSLLARITATWPKTPVVVIGPFWGTGRPTTKILAIRDVLQTVAGEVRYPFIDPLAEKWITGSQRKGTGNAARYILRDQIHPNTAGHHYFAARLAAHLRRLGLTSPGHRS